MQKHLLRLILGTGILLIPFAFKREKLKDWLLIFFLKGYISSFIDQMIVKNRHISYPIRFLPKYFNYSVLFDYLLFPLLCVFYNRTSLTSKPLSIFLQSFIYSLPMTLFEAIVEKYTKLIKYRNNWNWLITYSTLVTTFLFVRGFISIIRRFDIANKVNWDKYFRIKFREWSERRNKVSIFKLRYNEFYKGGERVMK